MLPINRLLEYQAELVASLLDDKNKKMFNYSAMVIDDSELANHLKERVEGDNTFLISIVPEFHMKGEENNSKWDNVLAFFILDKTDYSGLTKDSFINIFSTTQVKAQAIVDKLLSDKADGNSMFCGFLSWLDENSISVTPVWHKNECNGWMLQINLDTLA
ncbi:hypothetical protein [Flavobacterium denitrificans]|uniref:hypothetical protein n=1 Tax=Flavobacterium denitrificans TaxID=281361 RepID=UPI00047B6AD0|nr:hypothetical protein [Flavobacterium denitrificans]